MSSAKEFALEQADLVAQLAKYSDRLLVIESTSAPERRAFIKLVDDRLPQSVQLITIKAGPGTQPDDLLQVVAEQMQLSPGIESPEQLVTAVNEALTGQDKALVVIEDADNWTGDDWTRLLEYIQISHDMASRHLLFMLTGNIGIGAQLSTEPQLVDVQGDLHLCTLQESDQTAANDVVAADASEELHIDPQPAPQPAHGRRFNPTLLVVAAISVVVVTVGGFALLSRSGKSPESQVQSVQIKPETIKPAQPEPDSRPPAVAENNRAQSTTPSAQAGIGGSGAETQPGGTQPGGMTAPQTATPPTATPSTPSQATTSPQATAQAQTPATSKPPESQPTPTQPTASRQTTAPAPAAPSAIASEHQATPAPKAARAQGKPASKSAAHASRVDNAWYKQQARARAVVQLGAFNDHASASRFIKAHAGDGALSRSHWHVFTQKPHGQLLYTVTLGNFPSTERARHAVSSLPTKLKKIKPYPRSIGSIQDAITP